MIIKKKLYRLVSACFCLLFLCTLAQTTYAQSQVETDSIYGDSTFYSDTVVCGPGVAPAVGNTGSLASGSKVYVLGDSITVGTEPAYRAAFDAKTITQTYSAVIGRSWKGAGNPAVAVGTKGPASEAVQTDAPIIAEADGIVIALGTNGYESMNPIDEILTAFRGDGTPANPGLNPTAPIWWVNIANSIVPDNAGVPGFNTALTEKATAGKIQVVDWKEIVDPGGDGTKNPGGILADGIHPTPDGSKKLADLVVGAVTSGAPATPPPTTGSNCQCPADASTVSSTLPPAVPEPHRSLFTEAAASANVNPQFLTALFLTENGNNWRPFDSPWASSQVGASGPFQFMPGTWGAYATDGDGDGTADINNIKDAAYSAAKLIATNTDVSTPLGELDKPYAPGTILYSAAAYNWGGGNLQRFTTPDSPLSAGPQETQNYLINVSSLIKSGFTKSDYANYGNPKGPDGSPVTGEPTTTSPGASCSSGNGVVAGNIVDTAVGLAWDRDVGDSSPPFKDASTTAFQEALPKYSVNANVGGDIGYTDCGRFVGTVMDASGVDKDYPDVGTGVAAQYVQANLDKYEIIDNVTDTSQLKPGDILINAAAHTYIYVGPQPNGYDIREASYGSRIPQSRKFWVDPGAYIAARHK